MIYTVDTENCIDATVKTTYDSPFIRIEFDIRRDHLVEGTSFGNYVTILPT